MFSMFAEPWIEYDLHNEPVDLLALRLRLQLIRRIAY